MMHRFFLLVFICAMLPFDARAVCRVWFGTSWMKFKDTYRSTPDLMVDNGTLRVQFLRNTFWTIGEIHFKDELVGQLSGGTGSVVHWDGKPVGTVHRDGEIAEKLLSVELTVDGKTTALYGEDKLLVAESAYFEGEHVVLVKKSLIGPFLHQAEFRLSASSPVLQEKNDYEAREAVTPERFQGYRFVFMHMMPLDMTEWMSLEGDGQSLSGTTADLGSQKDKVLWTRSVRAFACYSPAHKVGMCYVYPELYPGMSHFVFRGGKDSKFRSILFDREDYAVGERLTWSMSLKPFAADAKDWSAVARSLMAPGRD